MRTNHPSGGFTIIELMAVIVASAILALVAGMELYSACKECRRDKDGVAMQQDGRVALETIGHAIRPASLSQIMILPGELRVTSNLVTGVRVYQAGSSLYVDSDFSLSGNERTLINGRLVSFAVTNTTVGVQVTLILQAGDRAHNETIQGVFSCRN